MDAAIMDGRSRAAGAVACVRRLAHPVSAARAVMEHSRHVLLVGDQAERFARALGAAEVEPARLVTEKRRRQLERAREKKRVSLDHDEDVSRGGLVAVDSAGRVATPFTTRGMVGGWIGAEGAPRVRLFADE